MKTKVKEAVDSGHFCELFEIRKFDFVSRKQSLDCNTLIPYFISDKVKIVLKFVLVVIRGEVARIFDLVVTQMGAERVMGSSSEFQERIFCDGAELLTDGSLDVRTHAKRVFGELVSIL
jgi:hypothetical protein